MPKKTILLLTDIANGESEDLITAKYLESKYDVIISNLEDAEKYEDSVDLILVRNTWPSDKKNAGNYNQLKQDFWKRVKDKKLNIYGGTDRFGDHSGKDYLIELFRKGYPVIPSIDSIKDIELLPKSDKYLIKPKDGFSSIGVKILTRKKLLEQNPKEYIIQPFVKFTSEISFYFIGSDLIYCLSFSPSKIPDWPMPSIYIPTKEEIELVNRFVAWNKMANGIQRIDMIKTQQGEFLLLEVEDESPYFSLTEINETKKDKFLKHLERSLKKYNL